MSRTLLATYSYVEMDGQRFLRADTAEAYGSSRWLPFALLSAAAIVFFTFGVPYGMYR